MRKIEFPRELNLLQEVIDMMYQDTIDKMIEMRMTPLADAFRT